MSKVYNITVYKHAQKFKEEAPVIIQDLEKAQAILSSHMNYLDIQAILREVVATKLLFKANLEYAEKALRLRGRIK